MASSERRDDRVVDPSRQHGGRRHRIGLCQARNLPEPERGQEVGDHRHHSRAPAGLVLDERRDRRGQLDGRVVVVRHRAVAGRAGRPDPRPDDALLGDLDRVEAPAVERDRVAADLVEGGGRGSTVRVTEELGALLDESTGAVLAAGLLIGDCGEDDVATKLGTGASQGQHDGKLHRHHVLHVDRAAAPDDAVDELAAERISRPGLRVDRHDVEVAQQDQRRLGGRARRAQAAHARTAARDELDHLRLDARVAEHLGAVARGSRLASGRIATGRYLRPAIGRIHRRDPDQRAKVLDAGIEIRGRRGRVAHATEGTVRGRKASIATHASNGIAPARSIPATMSTRAHSSAADNAPSTIPAVDAALITPNVRSRRCSPAVSARRAYHDAEKAVSPPPARKARTMRAMCGSPVTMPNPNALIGMGANSAMRRRPIRSPRCASHGPSTMLPAPSAENASPTSTIDHPRRVVASGA